MTRKFFTIFLLLAFVLPGLLSAQTHTLNANGELSKISTPFKNKHTVKQGDRREISKITPFPKRDFRSSRITRLSKDGVLSIDTADTLNYLEVGAFGNGFGEFGQDVIIQWFVAPADMTILSVAIHPVEDDDAQWTSAEVKLVKSPWTAEQHLEMGSGTVYLGYFEASTRPNGANPFLEDAGTDGGWVSFLSGADSVSYSEWGAPWGADLWSDFGDYALMTDLVRDEYNWLDLSSLGTPNVLSGEVFGVAMKNPSATLDNNDDPQVRLPFNTNSPGGGIGFMKFYANGRLFFPPNADFGWWHRDLVCDVLVAVSLTGDRAPVISNVTTVITTLSTDAQTVEATLTDDNPSGGPAGIGEANIVYSTDGGDSWSNAAMSNTEGDDYSGDIPGQAPGTIVTYYVSAVDVEENESQSVPVTYAHFKPENQILWVYDASDFSVGFITPYYWASVNDSIFAFDTWDGSFGPVNTELLNNYQIVYHTMAGGPTNQGYDVGGVYKAYMDGATAELPRNVFISAPDYGFISGYADTTFPAGTFENDYLGVETLGPQDVNPASASPYMIDPVEGNIFTGQYFDFQGDSVQWFNDPFAELGFSDWIDNLTPAEGAVVDITDPNSEGAAVGIHNEGTNWKTVYWTIDAIASNFVSPEDTSSMYTWILNVENPLVKILDWFGEPVTAIADGEVSVARTFKLKQNYPNPFNPTTTIEYSIPNKAKVSLKVFDVRGSEVATLVDNYEIAGAHTVNFDASQLATGLYFYKLSTNNQNTLVRKMMFIK